MRDARTAQRETLLPPALRHVARHRGAFSVAALAALLAATIVTAAMTFFGAVTAGAAGGELSGRPGAALTVTDPVTPATAGPVSARLASAVRSLLPGLAPVIAVSVASNPLDLAGPGRSAAGLQTQLISLPRVSRHIVLISGTCTAPAGYPLPACLPRAAARLLHVVPGDLLRLRDSVSGATVQVRITGIFRQARPGSAYWTLDPLGPAAVQRSGGYTVTGPLVVSPAAAAGGRLPAASIALLGEPDLGRLGGTGLAALGNRLAARIGTLENSANFTDAVVTTQLPGLLATLATALVAARTQVLAGLITLLVIAGATLSAAVRMLTRRREIENALLGARGAARYQIARDGLPDVLVVAGPALLAGPFLGSWLATALLRSDALAHPDPAPAGASWLAAAAVAAGCVAMFAAPWLRRPPSPVTRRARRGRAVAVVVVARADLAIVVLAGAACWQLVRSPSPVSAGLSGQLSADPVLVAAPVLALVAGAVVTLRAIPFAARLAERTAARSRGLITPAAAWQISRRTLRQAGVILVVVLAVAGAVMAVTQRDSWRQSVAAQASFAVGADARITLPPAAALAAGQVARITAAPGVIASTPVVRSSLTLPGGGLATLLAADARAAATIIPQQADGPGPTALRKLAAPAARTGVPIPGHPSGLRLTAKLSSGAPGQTELYATIFDAAGVGYLLPVGSIPADGRPHTLSVTFAASHRADYPLRLTGFTLQYAIPRGRLPDQRLTIGALRTLPGGRSTSGSGSPFRPAPAGAVLHGVATQATGGTAPAVISASTTGRAVTVVFAPGALASSAPGSAPSQPGVQSGGAAISLSDAYPDLGAPLPAIVTRSLLSAAGVRIGGQLEVAVGGTNVAVTPIAAVTSLPTAGAGSPALLVDQRALAGFLTAAGAPPPSVTQWWLRTGRPRLALTGLPPGTSVVSLSGTTAAMLADPLARAVQQALLAMAAAAIVLALTCLLIGIATGSERAADVTLLDALGMPGRQIARLVAFEQVLTTAAASAVGVALGAALSMLIVPADTLTAQATRPFPPLEVRIPWLTAIAVAAVLTALPPLIAAAAAASRWPAAGRDALRTEAGT